MKYLLRNQSVIVRELQGQLKSTLVCPHCNGISNIFDPFMFLSLPLPIKKTRIIFVSVVKAEPGQPIVKVGQEREREREGVGEREIHLHFVHIIHWAVSSILCIALYWQDPIVMVGFFLHE